jgi:hypothetical protein
MDTAWRLHILHAFAAAELGATTVRTRTSRTVVDVDRDPGRRTPSPRRPELLPTTTLTASNSTATATAPPPPRVAQRRATWFDPYHAASPPSSPALRARHPRVVLYDAHRVPLPRPRLFPGELPVLEPRHPERHHLRPPPYAKRSAPPARRAPSPGCRRPLQGRLDHPPPLPPGRRRPRDPRDPGPTRLHGRGPPGRLGCRASGPSSGRLAQAAGDGAGVGGQRGVSRLGAARRDGDGPSRSPRLRRHLRLSSARRS